MAHEAHVTITGHGGQGTVEIWGENPDDPIMAIPLMDIMGKITEEVPLNTCHFSEHGYQCVELYWWECEREAANEIIREEVKAWADRHHDIELQYVHITDY